MPQSKARKREYNRDRQRRRRGYAGGVVWNLGEGPREGVVPVSETPYVVPWYIRGDVVPDTGHLNPPDTGHSNPGAFVNPFHLERKGARSLLSYIQALNCQGYGLALTSRGYELVNLRTGEIGWTSPCEYQPKVKASEIAEAASEYGVLAKRVTLLEAAQALIQAQIAPGEVFEREDAI